MISQREDIESLKNGFSDMRPALESMASSIKSEIENHLNRYNVEHIDNIIYRVKGMKSFLGKASKRKPDGSLKYPNPLKEIQDLIGFRIVVYYKSDIDKVAKLIEPCYNRIEKHNIIPDDEKEFGYEGVHYIFAIPPFVCSQFLKNNPALPDFFELQILTLYQHAWAIGEHGLGYKPEMPLDKETKRLLAYVAAQSWGADEVFNKLNLSTTESEK